VTVVIFLPGAAFAIEASGLVNVPRTPDVTCPPNESQTIATSSVGDARLLAGLISITAIESRCEASAAGIVRSSRVGTINGTPIGNGPGSIGIPGVAQVFFNETTNADGDFVQNAVRVVKPPLIILGIVIIPGQEIILGGCRLG
jgi:hypothetical protein